MKFGVIKYHNLPKGREGLKSAPGIFNIGDNIQMLAMKRILSDEMNIDDDDIIEIDFHDLSTYSGEYVVVPINLFFFGAHDSKEIWFPTSPKILPVFIGLHLSSSLLTEAEVDYFRNWEPVGCRDEFTLSTMRKYGIESYLFGCITATFPKRDQEANKTIFLVDVDEKEVILRLPEKYKTYNIESVSHVFEGDFSTDSYDEADNSAKHLLDKYRNEAKLVITSRLHCASPCAAMGIPVIMIVKEMSQRFSWLSSIVKIYKEDEYDKIDWDVNTTNFEKIKGHMIDFVKGRITQTVKKYEAISCVSNFFEAISEKKNYFRPFAKFFNNLHDVLNSGRVTGYYIWGGTALAAEAFEYISSSHNEIKFLGIIDSYNEFVFQRKKSIRFEDMSEQDLPNTVLLVTPTSAKNSIMKVIESSGKKYKVLFADGTVLNL